MSEPDYPYPKKRNEPNEVPKKRAPPGMPRRPPTSPDLPPGQPPNLPPAETKHSKKDLNAQNTT